MVSEREQPVRHAIDLLGISGDDDTSSQISTQSSKQSNASWDDKAGWKSKEEYRKHMAVWRTLAGKK